MAKNGEGRLVAQYDDSEVASAEIQHYKEEPTEFYGWDTFIADVDIRDKDKLDEFDAKIAQAGSNGEQVWAVLKEFGLAEQLEKKISDSVYSDSDIYTWAYEGFIESLTEAVQAKNPDGFWYVRGSNLDWRASSGYKFFEAHDGKEFFKSIKPNTDDLTISVYDQGKNLYARISHHDVPMGASYYCFPLTAKQWNIYENGSEEQVKKMMEILK